MNSDKNKLETTLQERNPSLYYGNFLKSIETATPILAEYKKNFPNYTDHSAEHSKVVIEYSNYLLSQSDVDNLNDDEIYIILTAAFLHDIGMSISPFEYTEFTKTDLYLNYIIKNPGKSKEDVIRDLHHVLSYNFIIKEWKTLNIPTRDYAEAIALVAQGHRKIELKEYNPRYAVKTGTEFVCLPYLAVILRIADELDATNKRTPELLCRYHTPDNEKSIMEFEKHKSTYKVHFNGKIVELFAECYDINVYNALLMQVNKIQDTITYCQKILSNLSNKKLEISLVNPHIITNGFEPLNIKFNVDKKHLFETIIGRNLYNSLFIGIRECIQNSIDACRFKKSIYDGSYTPQILVTLKGRQLNIKDNGIGMDTYVLENYFANIGKSFYIHEANANPEFKSIGQFGIGAASYFLICDDYDVETKKHDAKALKFKVSHEYENYFFFLSDINDVHEGTQITFHLNQEASKLFDEKYLYNELCKTFKYIEIPIIFSFNNENKLISQGSLNEESIHNLFVDTFEQYYKHKSSEFYLLDTIVSSEIIDAACGLVLRKTEDGKCKPFKFINEYNSTEFKAIRTYFIDINNGPSLLKLYHQGVFIKEIKCTNLFKNIVGNINIKNKVSLKLDRNDFGINENMDYIFKELNKELLEMISRHLYYEFSDEEKAESSEIIITEYFNNSIESFIDNDALTEYKDLIDKVLYVKVILTDTNLYLYNYADLINTFTRFIITDIFKYNKNFAGSRDFNEIRNKYNLPTIINYNWDCTGFYLKWLVVNKYKLTIVNDELSSFIIVEKGKFDYSMIDKDYIIPFEGTSQVIATYLGRILVYNKNNPLINWLLTNNIFTFKDYLELKQLYNLIHNVYFEYIFPYGVTSPKILLIELNIAIKEFNSKHNVYFIITKDWFPSWLQECIIG